MGGWALRPLLNTRLMLLAAVGPAAKNGILIICQGAARARYAPDASRHRWCPRPLPPGDDDLFRIHPRPIPAGCGQRCVAIGPADVGTPVFGGMIFASFFGISVIPPLYVFFQSIRERLRPGARPREKAAADGVVDGQPRVA